MSDRRENLAGWAERRVLGLARHWLAWANLFWGLYVGLPILAPLLMLAGWSTPARLVYALYRPACHQRPERSFFLGGVDVIYSRDELEAAGANLAPLARDIGNARLGWKVAICERDVAIYGTILAAGLVFALVRGRMGAWRMRFRHYLPFLVPMGIDGAAQLIGFYESNWLVRSITGAIFGIGSVLFAYPYLELAFGDVRIRQERKLAPASAEAGPAA